MGNNQPHVYSVPVTEAQPGESAVYRHPAAKDQLITYRHDTMQKVVRDSESRYAKRNFLATLRPDNSYEIKTYSQVIDMARKLGSGLEHLHLVPKVHHNDLHLKFVGVFSKNREEWVLLDIANILYGNTMIPLYDTLGPETIPFVLNQSEITTCFCSDHSVKMLMSTKDLGKLKNLVLFDKISEDLEKQCQARNLTLYQFQDVINAGTEHPHPEPEVKGSDILTFSYTSGTTGNPKGAMLSHQNFTTVLEVLRYQNAEIFETDTYISYLPLPHVMERIMLFTLLGHGASIYFYCGDVQKLKDDLARVRPTIFLSVPRLFNRLYDTIKDKMEKLKGPLRILANTALNQKLKSFKSYAKYTNMVYDRIFFAKTKEAFGGRVRLMVTGSAPINGDTLDFLKVVACCPIVEAYGQTESCGASFATVKQDPDNGHVGGPTIGIEFKVVDIPEMNYTAKDKEGPRGEICMRGPLIFSGYYKDEEKTKETVDEQGWLHTGDVGMIRPNGSLKIIDRKKNIFKLQQGEYIAPEKIENIYLRVKGVAECFVYGDSLQVYCVAVIVPDKHYLLEYAKEKNIAGSFEELCKNPEINKHILDKITAHGKSEKLNGMELVKKIYLEPVSLMVHGCMTNTQKLQRHNAKLTFKPQLDQMYL